MRTFLALLLLAGSAFATSYSTNFPAGEMGHWIQGKTNGLDWCNVVNSPGFAFGTQAGNQAYDDSTATVTGTWGNDQSAQGVVAVPSVPQGSVGEVEIRLRTTINAHSITGYEFNASVSPAGGAYVQIVRWNGPLGSFTPLTGAAILAHSGDTLMATAVGSRLTWYRNGQALCATDDSTFPSGSPGIGMYTNVATNTYGFSSFSATDNGSSAPSPTPSVTPPPQAYAAWEASLLNEMQAAGIQQSRINTVQTWLANNPPKP
jgi:hypothetical protein